MTESQPQAARRQRDGSAWNALPVSEAPAQAADLSAAGRRWTGVMASPGGGFIRCRSPVDGRDGLSRRRIYPLPAAGERAR